MKIDMFGSLNGVERMLDFHMERHSVLASNVANAETPGYQAHDLVSAEAAGGGSLQTTDAHHIGGSSGTLQTTNAHHIAVGSAETESGGTVVEVEGKRMDGNGVALERALAEVSANRLRYESGVELAKRQLAGLRYAATDGGS
jgi:flagellar basal-body rod protein FlgB